MLVVVQIVNNLGRQGTQLYLPCTRNRNLTLAVIVIMNFLGEHRRISYCFAPLFHFVQQWSSGGATSMKLNKSFVRITMLLALSLQDASCFSIFKISFCMVKAITIVKSTIIEKDIIVGDSSFRVHSVSAVKQINFHLTNVQYLVFLFYILSLPFFLYRGDL